MSLLLLWLRLQRRPRSPRRRSPPSPPAAEATIAVSGSPEVVLDAIAVCEEVVENVTETKLGELGATILELTNLVRQVPSSSLSRRW
jgi:hypothetical protein